MRLRGSEPSVGRLEGELMPGEYITLKELVLGERTYGMAQERSRVVKLLNRLIEAKRKAAQNLGPVEVQAVEELMESGLGNVAWDDLVLFVAPTVLTEAREIVRE